MFLATFIIWKIFHNTYNAIILKTYVFVLIVITANSFFNNELVKINDNTVIQKKFILYCSHLFFVTFKVTTHLNLRKKF